MYNIYHHGDVAVCPLCGGYLKPFRGLDMTCIDCGSYFFPVKDGIAEREIRYEVIKGAKNEAAV